MAKLLAGVGAILAAISPVEHIVGIIGVVLFLVGAISLADFYGDQKMKDDAIYWFIFIFIALVVLIVGASLGAPLPARPHHGPSAGRRLRLGGIPSHVGDRLDTLRNLREEV